MLDFVLVDLLFLEIVIEVVVEILVIEVAVQIPAAIRLFHAPPAFEFPPLLPATVQRYFIVQ